MFVCKNCIDKFEPVVALATFYKTCEMCGEMGTCLDLSPNVKRINTILELIIEHKDGKFINWSMRDPNDPTRKFGEDDVALIQQVVGEFHPKEPKEGKMSDIEKAKRLLGDIQVLLHPAKLGIELEDEAAFLTVNVIDAYCKSIDALVKLDNMEDPITERFQIEIDKYNEMIVLLKEMITMIEEPDKEMAGCINELWERSPLSKVPVINPEIVIDRLVKVVHEAYCEYWNYLHPEFMKKGSAEAIAHAVFENLDADRREPCPVCGGDRCPICGGSLDDVGCGRCGAYRNAMSAPLYEIMGEIERIVTEAGEEPDFECDVECSMEATTDDCYECQKEQGVIKEPTAEEPEKEGEIICPSCTLRAKASEFIWDRKEPPAEEPLPINREHPGMECCCPECMVAEDEALAEEPPAEEPYTIAKIAEDGAVTYHDPPPPKEYPCDTGPDHHGYCTVSSQSLRPTLCREARDRHVCPAEEHDPGLFAWECPKCKSYGDDLEGPRPMICPGCGADIPPIEKLDMMWKWIDRNLNDDFFETAGKITDKKEYQERMNEIPDLLKPLAYVIITLACKNKEMMDSGGPCILFRHELFAVHKELLEKGIDIHLPYAWFCDGVMIEPEWIVRITNGIVGWSCNPNYDNPDTCGLEDCRYRRFDPSITTISTPEPCLHPEDKIVFVNEDVATLLLLDEGFYCKVCKARIESPAEKPCPKCGKFMTWHEKKVGYCFKCHPHEPPADEPECDHCAGTGEAKLDEFGDVLYSGEFGPCPYCNIPTPPRSP